MHAVFPEARETGKTRYFESNVVNQKGVEKRIASGIDRFWKYLVFRSDY